MILAVGLTPAWQQILLFDAFTIGEVNRAQQALWCASGKVLNVAVALKHLGADCQTLAVIGGLAGEAIEREFNEMDISARWIRSQIPTRVCTTILDQQTATTTELVENSRRLTADELEHFRAAFADVARKATTIVVSGSMPRGTPNDFYRHLLERAPGRVIMDARGPELSAALPGRPLLVKPNREELAQTVGSPLNNDTDVLRAMRTLNDRGAEWVVATQGAESVWVTGPRVAYRLIPPTAEVVNPIGCGDCVAAGIAFAVDEGQDMVDAVRFGMACAAGNVSQLLPARLDCHRARDLAKTIEGHRLDG